MSDSCSNVPDEIHLDENYCTVVGRGSQKTGGDVVCVILDSSKTPCMLSQRHSALKYDREKGCWTIEDLKSLNGVYVNMTKIEPSKPVMLKNGDEICFGTRIAKNEFKYILSSISGTISLQRKKRKKSACMKQKSQNLNEVSSMELSEGVTQCTETKPGDGPSQDDDLDLTPPLQKQPRLELDSTSGGTLMCDQTVTTSVGISCAVQSTKAQSHSLNSTAEVLPVKVAPISFSAVTNFQHSSPSCVFSPQIVSSPSTNIVNVSEQPTSMSLAQPFICASATVSVSSSSSHHQAVIPIASTPFTSPLMESSSAKPSPAMSHTSVTSDEVDDLFDTIIKRSDSSLLDEAIFGAAEHNNVTLTPGKKCAMDGATIQVMLAKTEMEQEKHHLLSSIEALKTELAAKNDMIAKKEVEQKEAGETVMSSMKEEFTCVICQELFIRAHTLSCSHSFCEWCVKNWLKSKRDCPICRVKVTGEPVRSLVLDNAISKLEAKLDEEDLKERENLKEEHRNFLQGAAGKSGKISGVSASGMSDSVIVIGTPPRRTAVAVTSTSPLVVTDSTDSDSESEESESYSEDDYEYYHHGYGGYGRCYYCGKRHKKYENMYDCSK